jgi:hypothetical protein
VTTATSSDELMGVAPGADVRVVSLGHHRRASLAIEEVQGGERRGARRRGARSDGGQ